MALMKKILSLSLICLMANQSIFLFGIESDESNNEQVLNESNNKQVLEGTIFIIRNHMRYMYLKPDEDGSCEKTRLEDAFGVGFKESEPVVRVWAYNDKSSNWSEHYFGRFSEIHPLNNDVSSDVSREPYKNTFPRDFPASLLIGKKEDDTLECKIFGLPVKLKCQQLTSCYGKDYDGNPVPFHKVFKDLQKDFERDPSLYFDPSDEEILIKKEILLKTECVDKLGYCIFKHGSNKFRFNNKNDDSFHDANNSWFKWLSSWFK